MRISDEQIQQAKLINPIKETVENYGIKINREGFCKCPFHNGDNTPSMKIYANGTFNCFACGANGDVIKFTQLINGSNFYGALKLLDVDVDRPLSWQEDRRLKKQAIERKALQEKIQFLQDLISDYDRKINALERQIRAFVIEYEDLSDYDETDALNAENERMKLFVKRSNTETILSQYKEQYERYRNAVNR